MAAEYVGRRRRDDNVLPSPALAQAVQDRLKDGSRQRHQVTEADCPNGAGCDLHPFGHDRRAATR